MLDFRDFMKRLLLGQSCPARKRALRLVLCALVVVSLGTASALAAPAIGYVQGNYATPQTPQTTVSVLYNKVQTAGDLNVVVVGWSDTSATISSLTDTSGNNYALAVGSTVQSGIATQAIYYARNILPAAAKTNTVTVTFSTAAAYPDIRILEYSGADPIAPVDVTAAATGNSGLSNSGFATTTNAVDLIFGANLVQTNTRGPGSGFTRRLLTNPDGDIAEDRMVTAKGTYAATAPLSSPGLWIMQLVAFRATVSGDTQPPTAPGNLTATPVSGTQINLSWNASVDNVGVTQYFIERCQGVGCSNFAQIGTATGLTYNDTGLTNATSYSYRVRATDAAGNLSPYSNVATATTPDTQPPTAPANLSATAAGGSQVNLSWTASTDNVGVTQYFVERCQGAGCSNFVQVGTSATPAYTDVGLTPNTSYSYRVRATDAAGNLSGYSNVATAVTQNADTQPPTAPTNLGATPVGGSQINLSWTASSDNVGVTGYLVERCQGAGCTNFVQIATPSGTTYNDTGLTQNTSYSYRVRATDAAGNLSGYSNVASATTADTQPPTAPTNLAATPSGGTQINLTWTASTDNVGVTQYFVERCQGASCSNFAQIGSSATTTFNDTGLTNATSYSYRVRATDAAGNLSGYSNVATAITADTQPPTAPTSLAANPVGNSQINLNWNASTDNVGVTQYFVERCQGTGCSNFVQIAVAVLTSYPDQGLTPNTSYSYRVRATDAAGNLSGYSNVASATTATNTLISYVQGNYATPQAVQSTVTVRFNGAQTAGNLNVVVVGWNDTTATVSSVTDSVGNTYQRAVGPTVISGLLSQSIYYARNIFPAGAGANTVTVVFSTAAAYADIRVLEYSGADLANPVDVTAAGTGNGGTSDSGSAATTSAPDLIFGANTVRATTLGPGSGFTQRLLTSPDSDIAEDRMVTGTGSYNATAPVSSDAWIMQMVAFRTAVNNGDNQPPTAPTNLIATAASGTQINLSWSPSSDNVGVTQYLIERCQGAGCSNFAQIGTSPTTTYSDTGLTGSASYSYRVRATDLAGNLSPYSNVATAITAISISPRVAALTFTRTQQFTSSSGSVTWLVDGVVGGTAASGTITSGGLYTPPSATGTHTVTAQDQAQAANATVYITNFPGTYTRDYDTMRTGQNLNETVLKPANITSAQFGKLFTYSLDGLANASPLYVANVNIPGQGYHNVVYAATEHDSVYAFDADGLSSTPLWQVSFINPGAGITTVPPSDVGDCCPSDIPDEIGITGTPVIDPTTGTLYVVAKTKEVVRQSTNYVQRLHALDIATGAEKFGGPKVIQASVPGSGDGSFNGQVPFDALHENQRAALLLSNGVVYMAFAGHSDVRPYHGWVLGYNAATLQQVMAYNVSPNGFGGGIWQSGDGLATDSTGRIYFVTGNGDFDVDTGGLDYGDSIEVISPSGIPQDYFTPHDQDNMQAFDLDLGSGGMLLVPDQPGSHPHLGVSAGKNGTIYVVDRDNMGHYNKQNDNQIVQTLVNIFPGGTFTTGNFKAPIYFNGALYFSADADYIKSFKFSNGLLPPTPTSQTPAIFNYPGATMSISANATSNGILWAVERIDIDPNGNGQVAPGVLHAYDPNDLTVEFYNSNQAPGGRDTLDYTAKWDAPLVANGKVYVTSKSKLTIFGLLP